MATTLSPTQQLSAAQNQFNNWYKQYTAGGTEPNTAQINAYKAAILNSGAYPALDIGKLQSQTNDSFFISGTTNTVTPDRSSGYDGNPILTGISPT